MELKSGQFSIMDRMDEDRSVVKVEMFRPDFTRGSNTVLAANGSILADPPLTY
jgi:hypothetical protein